MDIAHKVILINLMMRNSVVLCGLQIQDDSSDLIEALISSLMPGLMVMR